jgi:hypothetical protein
MTRKMLEVSAAGRAGTPDEVGTVGALLMGPDGAFIAGGDFLMDGGVTAAYWFVVKPFHAALSGQRPRFSRQSLEVSIMESEGLPFLFFLRHGRIVWYRRR